VEAFEPHLMRLNKKNKNKPAAPGGLNLPGAQACFMRLIAATRNKPGLFLLVAVLSQTFFALVRSHLVAFSFLSAGHFRTLFWRVMDKFI